MRKFLLLIMVWISFNSDNSVAAAATEEAPVRSARTARLLMASGIHSVFAEIETYEKKCELDHTAVPNLEEELSFPIFVSWIAKALSRIEAIEIKIGLRDAEDEPVVTRFVEPRDAGGRRNPIMAVENMLGQLQKRLQPIILFYSTPSSSGS